MKTTSFAMGIFILIAIGGLLAWLWTTPRGVVTTHEQRIATEPRAGMMAATLGAGVATGSARELTEEGRKQREDHLRYSRQEISNAHNEMNKKGAQAKITLQIIDQEGNPVVGATIKAYFTQLEGSSNPALVTGVSDGNGLFTVEKLTTYQCRWEVGKEGFYETQGRYEWQSKFTMEGYRAGRWQPWNPTVEVVLKQNEMPIKLDWKRVITYIPEHNDPVGFDCEKNDWGSPFGSGEIGDLFFDFFSPGGWESRLARRYTNELTISTGNIPGIFVEPHDVWKGILDPDEGRPS